MTLTTCPGFKVPVIRNLVPSFSAVSAGSELSGPLTQVASSSTSETSSM